MNVSIVLSQSNAQALVEQLLQEFIHVRIDGSFIDSIHQQEYQHLVNWIQEVSDKKIVLLELGSGFSTPAIIRYPMEQITRIMQDATLVRVNLEHAELPNDLNDKGISIKGDIKAFIDALDIKAS